MTTATVTHYALDQTCVMQQDGESRADEVVEVTRTVCHLRQISWHETRSVLDQEVLSKDRQTSSAGREGQK